MDQRLSDNETKDGIADLPTSVAELRALVIEQNHGAQFYRHLRAWYDLPPTVRSLSVPGPLPLRPGAVRRAIEELEAGA